MPFEAGTTAKCFKADMASWLRFRSDSAPFSPFPRVDF